jgi:thymidylate kinase
MIKTKLIIIEGVPGSGKSTIADKLKNTIITCGIDCECFLEWSPGNPIVIGSMESLSEIIDPHLDWETTMNRVEVLLKLGSKADATPQRLAN